jgi:3-oxoacyl-[acyl-carrier-protein] synthase II
MDFDQEFIREPFIGGEKILKRRVVVTGVGVVSPIGIGKEEFWKAVLAGKCGVDFVTRFDASTYPCKYAAEVREFDAPTIFGPKLARRLSRGTQFAIVSTQNAIEDAKLDLQQEDPYRVGVCYGSSVGPVDIYERFGATFYERGIKRVNPIFEGLMNHNALIGGLTQIFKIYGYNLTISTACCAGNMAIAHGFHAISSGMAEVMIAGGADTPIFPLTYGLYAASNSMTSHNGDPKSVVFPYDRRRSGFVLGEGSGTLILEELTHAQKRGAKIYAEILGFGLTNDAEDSNLFSANIEGIVKAFQLAIVNSSIIAEDVDYICGAAHSSVILDRKESQAIKKAFGEHAYNLAVSSLKGAVGHSMAGGTAIQCVGACLALSEGILPPTINYELPDPELNLDYVPKYPRKKNIRIAMTDAFGLGGTNIVVVFKKF